MTGRIHPKMPEANPVEQADAVVADLFLPQAGRGIVRALGSVSDLSDQEPLYAAAGAIIVTGLVMRDERTIRAGTHMLAAHLLATAIRGMVKHAVDRTRPKVAAERGYEFRSDGDRNSQEFNSFPSGHTAGAVAVARAIGRYYPSARLPALGIAGAASLAQVARSRHYLSDIAAGAAVAIVGEAVIALVVRRAGKL